ncbi:hypothetical protein [Streptomyces sp. GQFP]|uniref:hypothetical protein n=1 Tax=Streptomyces sp. GQFP TaxID=2907545 RepID=UPI001F384CEF|nr:hypothetical protein [Streptomyces sp. GQFP]UIX29145.1 hypothetical protein LUX31_03410 [Streptomyces sp. GQFP]
MQWPKRTSWGAGAAGVMCALAALAGCAAPGGLRVEGTAPDPLAEPRSAYVLDYASHPWRRPERLALSDVDVALRLRWSSWGASRATASGFFTTPVCTPRCTDLRNTTFAVRVVLDGQVRRQRATYYRYATVLFRTPNPSKAAQFSHVALPVPAP